MASDVQMRALQTLVTFTNSDFYRRDALPTLLSFEDTPGAELGAALQNLGAASKAILEGEATAISKEIYDAYKSAAEKYRPGGGDVVVDILDKKIDPLAAAGLFEGIEPLKTGRGKS